MPAALLKDNALDSKPLRHWFEYRVYSGAAIFDFYNTLIASTNTCITIKMYS